jgi:hypothetical protein
MGRGLVGIQDRSESLSTGKGAMTLDQFMTRWGTHGAASFLELLSESDSKRLDKPGVRETLAEIAKDLGNALLSVSPATTQSSTPHHCHGTTPQDETSEVFSCGVAFTVCYEKDEKLFVANGEYTSQVSFCPYCGAKAKTPAITES